MLFGILLNHVINNGSLRVIAADGDEKTYGDGTGALITIRLHNQGPHLGLAINPYLKLGEAYMDGDLTIDPPHTVYDLLALILSNLGTNYASRPMQLYAAIRRWKRRIDQHNPIGKAQANVAHHYDLDGGIYDLFLDIDKQYSCAYYAHDDMSLEEAQRAKKKHIIAKLGIEPDMRVLDIGCGWGALVIRAATKFGAKCVGVTLSQNQFNLATQRVKDAGLEDKIEIRLQDYRDVEGQFDRITSVGMFEHVGRKNLPEYFSRVRALLKDDGIAMNHGITSSDADSGETSLGGGEFIDKYVFPDGELPHLSLAIESMQRGGLEAFDIENLRRHYAHTLNIWAENFEKHSDRAQKLVDDEKFRIWRVYLAGCAYAFTNDDVAIYQIVCRKAGRQADTLPWSRRYMYEKPL